MILAPLITLPQIVSGIIYGYARMALGFQYALLASRHQQLSFRRSVDVAGGRRGVLVGGGAALSPTLLQVNHETQRHRTRNECRENTAKVLSDVPKVQRVRVDDEKRDGIAAQHSELVARANDQCCSVETNPQQVEEKQLAG